MGYGEILIKFAVMITSSVSVNEWGLSVPV